MYNYERISTCGVHHLPLWGFILVTQDESTIQIVVERVDVECHAHWFLSVVYIPSMGVYTGYMGRLKYTTRIRTSM